MCEQLTSEVINLPNLFWEFDDETFHLIDTEGMDIEEYDFEEYEIEHDRIGRVIYMLLPPTLEPEVKILIKYQNNPHITIGDIDRVSSEIEYELRGVDYEKQSVLSDSTVYDDDFLESEANSDTNYDIEDEVDEEDDYFEEDEDDYDDDV